MPTFSKRRALGQHFLIDQALIGKIVDKALELAGQTQVAGLFEIGPGRGALTLPLLQKNRTSSLTLPLIVCERDRELAAYWSAQGDTQKGVQVLAGDFLDLDESLWLPPAGKKIGVVSNLPYSAGTAIFTRLARHPDKVPFMVLMFQAEVARRLRAEPGQKEWGSLSVWTQNIWDVTRLAHVPPRAFKPPPKVDSEVVILVPREQPRIQIPSKSPNLPNLQEPEELWERLLKVAFAHRRKMLRSGLPASGPWRNALVQASVDGTKRAEALSWEEWRKLFEALS